MSSTAYLVGVIDTRDGTFVGAGIFSEDSPTLGHRRWCFTIAQAQADDYVTAVAQLEELIKHPTFAWAKRLYKKRGEPAMQTKNMVERLVLDVLEGYNPHPAIAFKPAV